MVLPEAAVDQSSLLFPRPRVRGALGIQSVFLQPTWVGPVAAVPPVAHPVLHPSQCNQAGAEKMLKGRNLCLNHTGQCTAKKLKRSPRWLPVAPRCKAQRVGGSLHPPTHPPRGVSSHPWPSPGRCQETGPLRRLWGSARRPSRRTRACHRPRLNTKPHCHPPAPGPPWEKSQVLGGSPSSCHRRPSSSRTASVPVGCRPFASGCLPLGDW